MLSDLLNLFNTTATEGLGQEITRRFEEKIASALDPKAALKRVTRDIQVLSASAAVRSQIGLKPMGALMDSLQKLLAAVRKAKKDLQAASAASLLTEYTNEVTAQLPTVLPFEIPKITIPPVNENLVLFDVISIPINLQLDLQIQEQLSTLLNRLRDEVRALALLPAQLVGIAEDAAKQILIDKLTILEEFLLLSLEGFHFGFDYTVATPDWQTLFAGVTL